jgi:hypothetical protein
MLGADSEQERLPEDRPLPSSPCAHTRGPCSLDFLLSSLFSYPMHVVLNNTCTHPTPLSSSVSLVRCRRSSLVRRRTKEPGGDDVALLSASGAVIVRCMVVVEAVGRALQRAAACDDVALAVVVICIFSHSHVPRQGRQLLVRALFNASSSRERSAVYGAVLLMRRHRGGPSTCVCGLFVLPLTLEVVQVVEGRLGPRVLLRDPHEMRCKAQLSTEGKRSVPALVVDRRQLGRCRSA